jgi:Holliday junction resolvase RusA-like endonuclease
MTDVGRRLDAIEFTVQGTAITKGSTKAFVVGSKVQTPRGPAVLNARAVITADNKTTLERWHHTVNSAAKLAAGTQQLVSFFDEALVVSLEFGVPRPASVKPEKRPHPIVPPDLDKLTRAVLDALKGVLYRDDAQICHINTRKRYVAADATGYARVRVGVVRYEP